MYGMCMFTYTQNGIYTSYILCLIQINKNHTWPWKMVLGKKKWSTCSPQSLAKNTRYPWMPCTGITPFAWASPNCSVPAMLLGRASVSMNAVVRHTSQRTLQDPESHTAGCVLSTFSAGPRCWHIYLETVGECMERYTHEIYLLTVNMYHHVSMYHLSLYESYANNIQ